MKKKEKTTEEAYDVEEIIGYKCENGNDLYHVKWIGYKETTWEPVSLLDNCGNLIKDFWNKQKQTNQDSDIAKPKDPVDFRLKYNLPFAIDKDDHIIRKVRTKRDLIPWPNTNDEDEPVETSFFNLQTPPFLNFIERNQSVKWEQSGYEVFDEKTNLDPALLPKWKIHNIINRNKECFVQVEDENGTINEVEYEFFSSFFPNSLFEYYNYILPKKIAKS